MKRSMRAIMVCTAIGVAVLCSGLPLAQAEWNDIPELPSYQQYGNLLMNRLSEKHGLPWVTFSHWSHRLHYTCRVCHLELGFEMQINATDITEEKNKKGEFCGACHDGKTAFGHDQENCSRCHNGDINYGREKFAQMISLPMARFGNRVDWTAALKERHISPKQSIHDETYAPLPFKKVLHLEASSVNMPPAIFSHQTHSEWLDCANCHPGIFNIKQKTTDHFSMQSILQGKFCGVCHLNVAFPVHDCMRCHTDTDVRGSAGGMRHQ